jgi:tripartite-type tricarboxylate transporter receptor subunit TctC
VPVKVVNVGGDGGRKAWTHVERYAADGHVIGISSPNMAADYLTGVTAFDPDRFAPLAILYSEYIAWRAAMARSAPAPTCCNASRAMLVA